MEGAAWTLACARSHADGIGGIGWQRGCMAGNAAFPPQDTKEEVPLRRADIVCAATDGSAVLFEYDDTSLVLPIHRSFVSL